MNGIDPVAPQPFAPPGHSWRGVMVVEVSPACSVRTCSPTGTRPVGPDAGGGATAIASTFSCPQHEQDLDVSAASFVAGDRASAEAFRAWVSSERALQRYPEAGTPCAAITMCPPLNWRRFGPGVGGHCRTVGNRPARCGDPGGARPYYCLETAPSPVGDAVDPPGRDYCDTALTPHSSQVPGLRR